MNNKIAIWIDPTDFCNLACKLCYTKSSQANNFLTLDKFKLIFDKLNAELSISLLHLNWRGEPLINPATIQFINYLNEQRVSFPIHLHTNGTILSKKFINGLSSIKFAIDFSIFFSIDGGNKENHENNRGANTFDITIENYNKLATNKSKKYKLGIYELKGSEMSEIAKYLAQEPDVYYQVNPIYPSLLEFKNFYNKTDRPFSLDAVNIEQLQVPKLPCFFAGNTFAINPLGDVYVCLLSHSKEGILGNIFEHSISKILLNAKQFREDIEKKGRGHINHCRNCHKIEDPIYKQ